MSTDPEDFINTEKILEKLDEIYGKLEAIVAMLSTVTAGDGNNDNKETDENA